jgi:hypothetical protein
MLQATYAFCGGDIPPEIAADCHHINKTKFHPHSQHHKKLGFDQARVFANFTQTFESGNGLNYSVGYKKEHFHWGPHSAIRQENFDNLLVKFGGFTKEYDRWLWDANIGLEINTKHITLSRYTFFNGLLHGAYMMNKKTDLHIGLVGVTGMHYTHILPLLGFTYYKSQNLKFDFVFPTSASMIYAFNKYISVDLAYRFFLSRQRLGVDERKEYRRGLIAYRNSGIELGLTFALPKRGALNIHVGETLAGRLRISRENDRHRHHHKLDSALYYGASANFVF